MPRGEEHDPKDPRDMSMDEILRRTKEYAREWDMKRKNEELDSIFQEGIGKVYGLSIYRSRSDPEQASDAAFMRSCGILWP